MRTLEDRTKQARLATQKLKDILPSKDNNLILDTLESLIEDKTFEWDDISDEVYDEWNKISIKAIDFLYEAFD